MKSVDPCVNGVNQRERETDREREREREREGGGGERGRRRDWGRSGDRIGDRKTHIQIYRMR